MTTEKADLVFASMPYRIMHEFQIPLFEQMRERDEDFYERLEAAGFDHDWGDDGSGLFMKYLRRGSGYYIDVGAADLVANGASGWCTGQVDHLTEHAVVLTDGTELPADLVVYATGYGSMNGWAAELISQEVADAVGKVWGLGSDTTKDPGPWEGELRNMWKPTQQEELWFHGGNLHQSRHYSLLPRAAAQGPAGGHPDPGVPGCRRCTTRGLEPSVPRWRSAVHDVHLDGAELGRGLEQDRLGGLPHLQRPDPRQRGQRPQPRVGEDLGDQALGRRRWPARRRWPRAAAAPARRCRRSS